MDYEQYTAPPCVRLGVPLNPCAKLRFGEQLLNHIELVAEWKGWKFKGRDLVSPDGLRICPERLRGILFMEKAQSKKRLSGARLAKSANSARIICSIFADKVHAQRSDSE